MKLKVGNFERTNFVRLLYWNMYSVITSQERLCASVSGKDRTYILRRDTVN